MRHAAKVDSSQTDIVSALRAAGFLVWVQKLPVDLKCRHADWYPSVSMELECKAVNVKRLRKDRQKQTDYINAHGIPVVRTPLEALEAVWKVHAMMRYAVSQR